MGTDDIFKNQREERKKRKIGTKIPKPNSFLIVTEGEKTEPLYLNGLKKYITNKYGGFIDIEEVFPLIDISGEGKCTVSLLEAAKRLVNKSKIIYQNVWLAFDKDDFEDFDEAIVLAKEEGYEVAWSNQSFEYWLYIHFHFSDAALHRDDWFSKLSDVFKDYNINKEGYEKNLVNVFELVTANGGLKTAIGNASRLLSRYDNKNISPSQIDPSTTMHKLVLSFEDYISELLE